ncbi:hypothetical protein HHI36_008487 [Cryptolaemus montrouzieri]|uniref:Lipase domain-containing protein n=1 Tax=Cryptolaemus montrouzieri TaxID=559131 RepID=A0ABD2MSY3_9CUCU
MCVILIFLLLFIFDQIHQVTSWQWGFGDCQLFYEEPCNPRSINFLLSHSKNGALKQQILNPFNPKIPKGFNEKTEIKIVIHGYGGLSVDSSTTNVTAAYLQKKYNIIIVDWEYLSKVPCYPTAFMNTWHVAQCTSILIVSLISKGISMKNIHIVGFSLGAHIAGFAGEQLGKTLGMKPSRITGLDPALPLFVNPDPHWKLDSGDADFVDVIHTSAGSFGKLEPSGHVDFYLNDGMIQPFCKSRPHPPLCSHILAGLYFAESILGDKRFIGTNCNNNSPLYFLSSVCPFTKKAIMGEFVNKSSRGVFYINTAEFPPFALDDGNFGQVQK